jgi:hypothetical protein
MVTFIIGKVPNAQQFLLHRDLVYKYSPVMKAAFESPFIEGEKQEYRLEENSEEAFKYLMQWLYSKHINFTTHFEGEIDWSLKDKKTEEYGKHLKICKKDLHFLIELWILGDKFMIPGVQNAAIRQIAVVAKSCIIGLLEQIRFVYAETLEDCALRRFIVHHTIWHVGKGFWAKSFDDIYPKEFLIDVAHEFSAVLSDAANSVMVKNPRNRKRSRKDISEFFIPTTS